MFGADKGPVPATRLRSVATTRLSTMLLQEQHPHPSMAELQEACAAGVPEELRGLAWRLLLNVLPLAISARAKAAEANQSQYKLFLQDVNMEKNVDTRRSQRDAPPSVILSVALDSRRRLSQADETGAAVVNLVTELEAVAEEQLPLPSAVTPSPQPASPSFGAMAGARSPAPPSPDSVSSLVIDVDASAAAAVPAPPVQLTDLPPPTDPGARGGGGGVVTPAPSSSVDSRSSNGRESSGTRSPSSPPPLPVVDRHAENAAQIDKDLERTNTDLQFFNSPHNIAAMRRVLLTFARLNGGVGYVQGMSELLSPLWFVFARDIDEEDATGRAAAEADVFFGFATLMSDVRELFIPASDHSPSGVRATIARFHGMLRVREPEVTAHFATIGMDPHMFAFRWITTLLTREFSLPDTISLWDSILSDPHRGQLNYVLAASVAMVRVMRTELCAMPFGPAMKMLQAYPLKDLHALREAAVSVRREEDEAAAAAAAAARAQRGSQVGGTGRAVAAALLQRGAAAHGAITSRLSAAANFAARSAAAVGQNFIAAAATVVVSVGSTTTSGGPVGAASSSFATSASTSAAAAANSSAAPAAAVAAAAAAPGGNGSNPFGDDDTPTTTLRSTSAAAGSIGAVDDTPPATPRRDTRGVPMRDTAQVAGILSLQLEGPNTFVSP